MNKRKPISTKLRFEIFKRDKFKCQYCGRSPDSSDINLQVDHINPVYEGGKNELLNLITSCFDCNNGKGKRVLSDDSMIKFQKKELDELAQKREQMKMMFKWKEELQNIDKEKLNKINDYVDSKLIGHNLNEYGVNLINKLSKQFDLKEVLEGIDKAADIYLKTDNGVNHTNESAISFIEKIGGVIVTSKKSPIGQKISYIRGIGKNRFQYWKDKTGLPLLKELEEAYRTNEFSDEEIEIEFDDIVKATKTISSWSKWQESIKETIKMLNQLNTSIYNILFEYWHKAEKIENILKYYPEYNGKVFYQNLCDTIIGYIDGLTYIQDNEYECENSSDFRSGFEGSIYYWAGLKELNLNLNKQLEKTDWNPTVKNTKDEEGIQTILTELEKEIAPWNNNLHFLNRLRIKTEIEFNRMLEVIEKKTRKLRKRLTFYTK